MELKNIKKKRYINNFLKQHAPLHGRKKLRNEAYKIFYGVLAHFMRQRRLIIKEFNYTYRRPF
jgi:hypothetical protein